MRKTINDMRNKWMRYEIWGRKTETLVYGKKKWIMYEKEMNE